MSAPHSAPPRLTDRDALAHHRLRARKGGAEPSALDELHAHLADEIQSRLAEVNRRFTSIAVVSGHPDFWRSVFPEAHCVEDSPILALDPEKYDLVLHIFSMHWSDDPLGQIIQARRALAPDGLFLAVFAGGRSLNELRSALATAESELTGGLSPRVLPMADLRDAGGLLQRAGLALPVADSSLHDIAYRDLDRLRSDLKALGETSALAQRQRQPMPAALWPLTKASYAAHFGKDGLFPVTLELIWLTGWAPAESQPKPLRPGSAAMRLAQALDTVEEPIGDDTPAPRDTPSL